MKPDDAPKTNKSVDGKRTNESSPVQSEQKLKKDQNYRYNPELKKKAIKVQPQTSKLVQGKPVYTSPDVLLKSKPAQQQRNLIPQPHVQNFPGTQMGVSYPNRKPNFPVPLNSQIKHGQNRWQYHNSLKKKNFLKVQELKEMDHKVEKSQNISSDQTLFGGTAYTDTQHPSLRQRFGDPVVISPPIELNDQKQSKQKKP